MSIDLAELSLKILNIKTVALQAPYLVYFLLEAGIMRILYKNITRAKSFEVDDRAVILPKYLVCLTLQASS